MKKIFKTPLFIVLFLLIFPQNAHAYLDPGTGSYLLQIIAAVVLSSLFVFKSGWKQIKEFFSKLGGKKKENSANENEKRK